MITGAWNQPWILPPVRDGTTTGWLEHRAGDDVAVAPRLAGGEGASCDPSAGSADGCACRSGGTRAQGGGVLELWVLELFGS